MAERIRVVIAEDHPFFREGMRLALEKAEWIDIVAEASDGLTALEQVRSLKPRLAILDISLPRMNGFDIVRRIREEQILSRSSASRVMTTRTRSRRRSSWA